MLADMGPLRPLSEVGIIFGDGIFSGEGLLDILDIKSTCKICLDTFHLLSDTDGAWPKFFGTKAWPRLKEDFNDLVYSETEALYKVRHEALKARLATENVPAWNEYLENNVHGHRRQFARCYVSKYRFNLGREGSSAAEANHSSYVKRIGASSVEEPAVMVKDCMKRHGDMCKERQEELVNYRAKCIGTANKGKLDVEDTKALLALSRWAYELWTWAKHEATNYYCFIAENGDFIVRRRGMTTGGRVIGKDNVPCDCLDRIAFQGQCCHLIAANDGKFDLSLWDSRRWPQKRGLGPSLDREGQERNENNISTSSDKENEHTSNDDGDYGDDDKENEHTSNDGGDDYGDDNNDVFTSVVAGIDDNDDDDDDDDSNEASRHKDPEVETSYSYRDVMEICQNIASHISKRKDAATQVGILLQFEDALRDGGGDSTRSFEDTYRTHVSAFTRHARNSGSFMHSVNEDGEPVIPSQPPLMARGIRRDQHSGRLGKKRLTTAKAKAMTNNKRSHASLLDSGPRTSVCSFCKSQGHKKGTGNCDTFTALKSTFVDKNEIAVWSSHLGDPSFHAVEIPSNAVIRILSHVDMSTGIPKEVHHILLLKCFYSRNHTEILNSKRSTYKDNPNFVPPSVDHNILEVVLLTEGARRLSDETSCFLQVSEVKQWIRTNCKKSNRKFLLNSLLKPSPQQGQVNRW
jgi:hypothetical protein